MHFNIYLVWAAFHFFTVQWTPVESNWIMWEREKDSMYSTLYIKEYYYTY